jgi:farnesyl-diphosphate farnesyltransferase
MPNAVRADYFRLLKQVSRSFYLTVRILPVAIRPQVGLAYLLARATDTIADTQLVSVELRRVTLRRLRTAVATAARGDSVDSPGFGDFGASLQAPAGQGSSAERDLLDSAGSLLAVLRAFTPADRVRIGRLIDTIASGQDLDLIRFGTACGSSPVSLETAAELDDYTYRVAGCVGEFWTAMCRAHLFPHARLNDQALTNNGIRFGKGLQLVNILRDLPADLRLGRCYLPSNELVRHGITPGALLDPGAMPRFRPVLREYIDRAEGHLAAGWAYTNTLPRAQFRVRLACAWPILIGMKTLQRLNGANVLDGRRREKVSRSEVRVVMLLSTAALPFPAAWRRLFERSRTQTRK